MILKIYIDDSSLDLGNAKDLKLRLNKLYPDPQRPVETKGGDFSWTINLPRTKRNSIIFGHPEDLQTTDRSVFYKSFPCRIELSGSQLLDGYFKLTQVDNDSYKGVINAANIGWAKLIDSKNLRDLNWKVDYYGVETSFTENLQWYIDGADGQDVLFPFIIRGPWLKFKDGNYTLRDGIEVTEYYPSVRYFSIVKKIFEQIGYTAESPLFDTVFKDLLLTAANTGYKWNYPQLCNGDFKFTERMGMELDVAQLFTGTDTYTRSNGTTVQLTHSKQAYRINTRFSDEIMNRTGLTENRNAMLRIEGNNDTGSGTFRALVSGVYRIKGEIEFIGFRYSSDVPNEATRVANYSRLSETHQHPDFFFIKTGSDRTMNPLTSGELSLGNWYEFRADLPANGKRLVEYDFEVYLQAGEYLYFGVTSDLYWNNSVSWHEQELLLAGYRYNANTGSFNAVLVKDYDDSLFPEQLEVNNLLPSVSQKDFIRSFCELFNLYFLADERNKVIKFIPLTSYYNTNADSMSISKTTGKEELTPVGMPQTFRLVYTQDENDRLIKERGFLGDFSKVLVSDAAATDTMEVRLPYGATRFFDAGRFDATLNSMGTKVFPAITEEKILYTEDDDVWNEDTGDLSELWKVSSETPRLLSYAGKVNNSDFIVVGNEIIRPGASTFNGSENLVLTVTPNVDLSLVTFANAYYIPFFESFSKTYVLELEAFLTSQHWIRMDARYPVMYKRLNYLLLSVDSYNPLEVSPTKIRLIKL